MHLKIIRTGLAVQMAGAISIFGRSQTANIFHSLVSEQLMVVVTGGGCASMYSSTRVQDLDLSSFIELETLSLRVSSGRTLHHIIFPLMTWIQSSSKILRSMWMFFSRDNCNSSSRNSTSEWEVSISPHTP
jgi:hypothetical protein